MHSDVQLQRLVLDELDWEPSIDAAEIGVTVKDGVVTLTGHVSVYSVKLASEEVTKRVHGVKSVVNEIDVQPAGHHERDDAEIAAAAVHAVQWDAGVPPERVHVSVCDGKIALKGTVDWQFQRSAAERAVRHLVGARGVTNEILVKPAEAGSQAESGEDITTRIRAALRRSAAVAARQIDVETVDGNVTLTGDVHTHAEREEAERIAWSAQGVGAVDNCLTVTPWGHGPSEEWGY